MLRGLSWVQFDDAQTQALRCGGVGQRIGRVLPEERHHIARQQHRPCQLQAHVDGTSAFVWFNSILPPMS